MSFLPLFLTAAFRAEKISIPEALLLSLLGFAIVFVVLILLIIVIRVLTVLTSRKAAPSPSPVQAVETRVEARAAAESGKVPAPGSIGECSLHTVDDRTAALLMAIVADDLKVPLNELRFVSIRQI